MKRKAKYTETRKRAIAKALQLKGHSDFAPVDLAYYQHFLYFFCSKILRFGKFRVATTNAGHVTDSKNGEAIFRISGHVAPRSLSTLN